LALVASSDARATKEGVASESVRDHNRFDLQIKVVDVDEKAGTVQYYVQPDPGRYEWRDRGNERVLYDRFDNVYFPHTLVIDMLKRAMQMTPGPALGVIPDVASYVASRRPVIAAALRGESTGGALVDVSEAQLRAFEQDELAFVILSVDIKGSTKLQTSTDRQTFAVAINALLTEIAELVARFHGHVLKYTGDGLIAYFAPPTFIIKNDAALDCAFCVRRLVYDAINPELEAAGLPRIDVRLGLDGGEAAIVVLGSDKTKRHADLIGDVVSLACKIESRAGTGEIFLGETVHRNLHFSWRELCASVDLPADWTYSVSDGDPYPLFRVDPSGTRPVERPPHRQ
jgi:class 3 adenylate cyclase